MIRSLQILTAISLFSISAVRAELCNKTENIQKLNQVLQNIAKQSIDLERVLKGEIVKGYLPQEVFGRDFNVDQTESKVKDLKEINSNKEGILLENESLAACLKELKLSNEYLSLSSKSKNLNNLKIKILEKNMKLDDSLRESGITESNLPSIKKKIDKDSSEALKVKSTLEDSLIKKQTQSNKEKSTNKRESLQYESELTKVKIELLNLKIETNRNLEEKIKKFEKSSSELQALSVRLDSQDEKVLYSSFKEVEGLWLSLASENFFEILKVTETLKLPTIPNPIEAKDFDHDVSNILKLREEIVELRKDIVKSYTDKKNQELKLLNHLVANSNTLRENYFNSLGSSFFFKSIFDISSFKLIKNEIVSAPYRALSYFYSIVLYVREQLSIGKEGYVNLFGQLILVLFLVGSFYGLRFLFSKANDTIDSFFEFVFKQQKRFFLLRKLFSIWSKIKDSSIPILWLITLSLMQKIAIVNKVSFLIEIIEIYLWSNILKSIVMYFLGSISRLDSGNFSEFKRKAHVTSHMFQNIFRFYFLTMLFLEVSIGKVYIYSLINYFVVFYTLYNFVIEASRWEAEFAKYTEKMFAGVIVEKYFQILALSPKVLRASFILIFIILFMIFDMFVSLTENFEISKKISANLFKKQIEKVEAEEGADDKIPSVYKEHFSMKSLTTEEEYVENPQGLEEKITHEVEEWLDNRSDEHSVVIYGDKGVGKTTLLKRISSQLESHEELEVKYVKMPSKTITKKDMNKFMRSIFTDEESEEKFNVNNYDSKLEKRTIVIIDECQNVFLSQTGGFDAYYSLINLINLNTKNIFWIMSFNKYSWVYLSRAFGRTQFFRNVFELSGWTDTKIKELILKRHRKTDFRLSYDLLISATRSQDEIDKYASIESKFFKLLWELSRGNPRAALYLWISALSRKSRNIFNVNIPKEVDMDGIEKIPDELMFVISHVLRHENLSASEIESTTNLQKGLVRNAIKMALEKKFFHKDERSRFMVDISTQYGIIRILKVRNFIYGS